MALSAGTSRSISVEEADELLMAGGAACSAR